MAKSRMSPPEKFPRITPLRALELLLDMVRKAHQESGACCASNERTREALANHVKNALRRAGSR